MLQYFETEQTEVQVIRGSAGSYVDGEWIQNLSNPGTIRIVVPQPLRSNDLQKLPDGEHVLDYLISWVPSRLFTRSGLIDSDQICFNFNIYKIEAVDDWSILGNFYKLTLRRLDPNIQSDYIFDDQTGFLVIDDLTGGAVKNHGAA